MNINPDHNNGHYNDDYYNPPETGTAVTVEDPFGYGDEFDEVDDGIDIVTGKPETTNPTGWIIYAMETGEWKSSRRYNVTAETPKDAVEMVINSIGSSFIDRASKVTFEVFQQGTGVEFRYERALRQVYP